jgi:hypothetical protein
MVPNQEKLQLEIQDFMQITLPGKSSCGVGNTLFYPPIYVEYDCIGLK